MSQPDKEFEDFPKLYQVLVDAIPNISFKTALRVVKFISEYGNSDEQNLSRFQIANRLGVTQTPGLAIVDKLRKASVLIGSTEELKVNGNKFRSNNQ